jgi:DNA modification methylase
MSEEGFDLKYMERHDLRDLVTFIPNKKQPVYNWFYFKEGFSRELIFLLFDKFDSKEGDWVLDPFLGVGTTLLACKEKGINGVGREISPLFVFVSQVKLEDYDIEELREYSAQLFQHRFKKPDLKNIDPFIKKAFEKHNLEDIIFFRELLLDIQDMKIRNFFMLGLMNAASKVTYAYKDGAVLRLIRRKTPPLRPLYKRIIKKMINDLKKMEWKTSTIDIRVGDARKLDLEDECIDYVITSPPYLNKIEYTKVYEIEYKLFMGGIHLNPVRSYMGLMPSIKVPRDFPEYIIDGMPLAAQAYFIDMWRTLKEIHRVLKDNGDAAIIVAGGVFPDRIIESDIVIAKLGYLIGFKPRELWAVNKRVATRNRTIKIGVARESILFLSK